MTTGTSFIAAQPSVSAINENPGPEVDVEERVPVNDAPTAIPIAEISSSVCTIVVEPGLSSFTCKISCVSKNSLSSDAGVIG